MEFGVKCLIYDILTFLEYFFSPPRGWIPVQFAHKASM